MKIVQNVKQKKETKKHTLITLIIDGVKNAHIQIISKEDYEANSKNVQLEEIDRRRDRQKGKKERDNVLFAKYVNIYTVSKYKNILGIFLIQILCG